MRRSGLYFWLLAASLLAAPAHTQQLAEERAGIMLSKPDIFRSIEQCRPSRTREEVARRPELPLTVECADICIQERLNAWLAISAENREEYFRGPSVYKLERAAGLQVCRSKDAFFESPVPCLGPTAPDVLAKLGNMTCTEVIDCEARFDINDYGRPINIVPMCPAGPAKAELERETVCMALSMSFLAFRGRKNVVQPFEMHVDTGMSCQIS